MLESVPLEHWWIRCSIKARIGAIPVPGPTNIQGTSEPGACIPPFTSPTGISEPEISVIFQKFYPLSNQQAISYKHHIEVSLDSSCI